MEDDKCDNISINPSTKQMNKEFATHIKFNYWTILVINKMGELIKLVGNMYLIHMSTVYIHTEISKIEKINYDDQMYSISTILEKFNNEMIEDPSKLYMVF